MRTLTTGACVTILGCAPTVYLDQAHDAAVADIPSDALSEAAVDAPAEPCRSEAASDPLCPNAALAQTDETHPFYRVTQLQITAPSALVSPVISDILNQSIHTGALLWGLSFDLSGATMRAGAISLRTRGPAGQGLFDGRYRFYAGDAPAASGATDRWDARSSATTRAGDRVSSAAFDGVVRLPVYDSSGALSLELPLRCLRFNDVSLADRRCIGLAGTTAGRFNECTSAWRTDDGAAPYGSLTAVITTRDARATTLSSLHQTLCQTLAGVDCEAVPQTMWPQPPDGACGGEPGYVLRANFAAVSARPE